VSNPWQSVQPSSRVPKVKIFFLFKLKKPNFWVEIGLKWHVLTKKLNLRRANTKKYSSPNHHLRGNIAENKVVGDRRTAFFR
jgi:hypothetical protein